MEGGSASEERKAGWTLGKRLVSRKGLGRRRMASAADVELEEEEDSSSSMPSSKRRERWLIDEPSEVGAPPRREESVSGRRCVRSDAPGVIASPSSMPSARSILSR